MIDRDVAGRDVAGMQANNDGWPGHPYCECGNCHLEVIPTGEAWKVAGEGDLARLAVLPGHTEPYESAGFVIEHHDGWVAVAINGPVSDENVVSNRCPECNEYEPECLCDDCCPVTIPGIGACTEKGDHAVHKVGHVTWNGAQ